MHTSAISSAGVKSADSKATRYQGQHPDGRRGPICDSMTAATLATMLLPGSGWDVVPVFASEAEMQAAQDTLADQMAADQEAA